MTGLRTGGKILDVVKEKNEKNERNKEHEGKEKGCR